MSEGNVLPSINLLNLILGAVIGIIISKTWDRYEDVIKARLFRHKQIRTYLRALVNSLTHGEGEVLEEEFARFDVVGHRIERTVRLADGSERKAGEFFWLKASAGGRLRLLVHGLFGMGKSVEMKSLALRLAENALRQPSPTEIPILIPLVEFEGNTKREIARFLNGYLARFQLGHFSSFADLAKAYRCVFILDGLDQMDTSKNTGRSKDVVRSLVEFLDSFDARVILTMRTDYFETNRETKEYLLGRGLGVEATGQAGSPAFEVVTLENLNPGQIRRFIKRNWKGSGELSRKLANEIECDLHLREVAKHPLLLEMMLADWEVWGGPEIRGSGVANVSEIYSRYEERRLETDVALSGLERNERREFVRDLAIAVMLNREMASVHLSDVVGLDGTRDWMSRSENLTRNGWSESNSARSFLLVNRNGRIRFSHRSFAEHICAKALVQWLKEKKEIPHRALESLYSNLVVWFLRGEVDESDFDWLLAASENRDEVLLRRIGFALLPKVAGVRKGELLVRFREAFWNDPDVDARRHLLYGIGWMGEDPLDPEVMEYIEENAGQWQEASLAYYHSPTQQREHCVSRLRAFENGDLEYHGARGLYIIDLAVVGTTEDKPLLVWYLDPENESDENVRVLADRALRQIDARVGQDWSAVSDK
jgi:hypothetical protein